MRTRRVGAKDLSTIAHTTRKEGLSVNREEKRVQITRREVLQGLAATGTAAALSTARMFANPISGGADSVNHDALGAVDILLGTGGHGHCYPGATVPFGAVQLSPDTFNDGWDWCSGYHLSDSSIMGFSHTHLSGTGVGDLLDFLVMAGTGPAKIVPGTREHPDSGYRSRFDHADEIAAPGYYSVLLKDYDIRAELTATERTGLHRYTFPANEQSYLILDLQHGYLGQGQPTVRTAELRQTAADTFAGGRVTDAWAKGRKIYFTLQVSKSPTHVVFYKDGREVEPTGSLTSSNLKCVLYFNTRANEVIHVKTGISGVSAEGARLNLDKESPGWNFDEIRRQARAKWEHQLSKITVSSPNETHKRIFYTALYHMSLGPTLFDDVDGRYRGMDGEVHTLSMGKHNYSTFSLWDTYRAAHPAFTLIEPDRVPDFANTLIRMAEQSPAGMPVWPLYGIETGCMTGYHSAAVIAEAINKGFHGIDDDGAYKAMMQRAMVGDYRGLGYYRKLHFIPADLEPESVSKTFEYCYDDWAIAHVAKKLHKLDVASMLVERSTNYRNYFDKSIGFIRPKFEDGTWAGSSEGNGPTPFNPIDLGHFEKWRDYTESNAWQTTFGVQHDPAGLIALFGGREPFVAKLDELFTVASTLPADAPPDIAGLVGQYAHGNEPSHHIAYLYVYAGAPHKTQARVRSLLETMYAATPDGIAGNEDVGQMSAWYILSALGFYPVDAVSGNYILGSPLFNHASVNLGNGRELIVEVERADSSYQYIQSFTLNGRVQQRAWFHHSEIGEGGKLEIKMGPAPNLSFAADPQSAPPSLAL
jgi:predicted alpha-1,2-mannosidase